MSEADARPLVFAYDGSGPARVLGSTAEGILHHAHRPVLVVPDM